MILSVKERYTFIPAFSGNDKLSPAERVSCEIIRPTADEGEDLSSLEIVRDLSKKEVSGIRGKESKSEEDRPQKTAIRFIRRQDTSRILRDHIGKITNLFEELEGEGGKIIRRAINSGEDLADCKAFGIKGLIDELCAEVLRDKVTEDDEKNSESASSST